MERTKLRGLYPEVLWKVGNKELFRIWVIGAHIQSGENFVELPLLMQLEENAFLCTLKELTEQENEKYLFLSCVLNKKDWTLVAEYGMKYKGIKQHITK